MSKDVDPQVVSDGLAARWPTADCELHAKDPWEFLVAVVCSARTSDERVNQVMAHLSEHLIDVYAYAELSLPELEAMLKRLPLFRQKARAIHEAARRIIREYDGLVPGASEDLKKLPGVGNKTAAVVLGNRFGVPSIAVDLHVQRCSQRLGLTNETNPDRIERDLARAFPPHRWVQMCHQFIRLGRECCRPKNPWCSKCPFEQACPKHNVDKYR